MAIREFNPLLFRLGQLVIAEYLNDDIIVFGRLSGFQLRKRGHIILILDNRTILKDPDILKL